MTCRERLSIDHPNKLCDVQIGGASGCPSHYGYLDDPEYCQSDLYDDPYERCRACWDREIPEFTDTISPKDMVKDAPIIKDSGNRTEFDTGAVRDMREGKGRCDLMPLEVVSYIFSHENSISKIFDNISRFQKENDTVYLLSLIHI